MTEIAIERDPVGHRALSHEALPVQYIEAVVLGRGEALFIDEESAIKERCGCGARGAGLAFAAMQLCGGAVG